MRTGIKGSPTATSFLARTVLWWCGTTVAAGETCPATTICPTPAKRASVSLRYPQAKINTFSVLIWNIEKKKYIYFWFSITQRRAAHLLLSPMPSCLGRSGNATRPTPSCAIIALRDSCRNWTRWSGVCQAANGSSPRSPAGQVSSLINWQTKHSTNNLNSGFNRRFCFTPSSPKDGRRLSHSASKTPAGGERGGDEHAESCCAFRDIQRSVWRTSHLSRFISTSVPPPPPREII